jgi:hypothetical protein
MTYSYQISENQGRTWRTVAVGLDRGDIDRMRAVHARWDGDGKPAMVEGRTFRFEPER